MNETYVKKLECLCKIYERKLERVLGEKEFFKFVEETAQQLFMDEVENIEDPEFKKFILDNLDDIFNLGGNDDVPID